MRRPLSVVEAKSPMFSLLLQESIPGVWGLFELMRVAEEEIKAKVDELEQQGIQHGEGWDVAWHIRAQRVHRQAFKVLWPSEVLRGKAEQVYRSHARELIERVALQQDTTQATEAEVLCFISNMSFAAPLCTQWAAVVGHLFPRVMGSWSAVEGVGTHEPWSGSTEEVIAQVARKLVVPERVVGD